MGVAVVVVGGGGGKQTNLNVELYIVKSDISAKKRTMEELKEGRKCFI